MPRRNTPPKRKILSDSVYKSVLISKFINLTMIDGKRGIAESIVYGALDFIKEKQQIDDPIVVFQRAIKNVKPLVEVKARRVGGATYQVPVEVLADRGESLGMRWILDAAKKRNDKNMKLKLAYEILDASGVDDGEDSRGRGGAVKKREDTHKMAEANKAFSHYRIN